MVIPYPHGSLIFDIAAEIDFGRCMTVIQDSHSRKEEGYKKQCLINFIFSHFYPL
jgi:hypothetical protein